MEKQCHACNCNFSTNKKLQLYCGKCYRKCLACEKEFLFTSKAPKKRYCSHHCSGEFFKKEMIEKECLNCRCKRKVMPSDKQLFCSRACRANSQKKTVIVQCLYCNNDITTTHSANKLFCNKECYFNSVKRLVGQKRNCTKCGILKPPEQFHVNKNSWCKVCVNKNSKKYFLTPEGRYKYACGEARRRGLEWKISFQEHINLVSNSCAYCNSELSKYGIGLDRKNNNQGYIIENVVPCCVRCNRVKNKYFTFEEFKILGNVIKKIDSERVK